jgi:hypothetical protein
MGNVRELGIVMVTHPTVDLWRGAFAFSRTGLNKTISGGKQSLLYYVHNHYYLRSS